MLKRIFCLFLAITFFSQSITFGQPVNFKIPEPNVSFVSLTLNQAGNGLKPFPTETLSFNLNIQPKNFSDKIVKTKTKEILDYFFSALSVDFKDLWVNLNPNDPQRIIGKTISDTDLGKVLLVLDLKLKKDTSFELFPGIGKNASTYWERVFEKSKTLNRQRTDLTGLGQKNSINIPTQFRVWIVPDEAKVYEDDNSITIVKATLKVLLESEYLKDSVKVSEYQSVKDNPENQLQSYCEQQLKELILPELTRKVNLDKAYEPLRQIYQALILAQWVKEKLKTNSVETQNFASLLSNYQKTNRFNFKPEQMYQAYLKSVQKGEYKFVDVKDQRELNRKIKRTYASGGVLMIGRDGQIPVTLAIAVEATQAPRTASATVVLPQQINQPKILMSKVTPEIAEANGYEWIGDDDGGFYLRPGPSANSNPPWDTTGESFDLTNSHGAARVKDSQTDPEAGGELFDHLRRNGFEDNEASALVDVIVHIRTESFDLRETFFTQNDADPIVKYLAVIYVSHFISIVKREKATYEAQKNEQGGNLFTPEEIHTLVFKKFIPFTLVKELMDDGLSKTEAVNFVRRWARPKAVWKQIFKPIRDKLLDYRFSQREATRIVVSWRNPREKFKIVKSTIFLIRKHVGDHYGIFNSIIRCDYPRVIASSIQLRLSRELIDDILNPLREHEEQRTGSVPNYSDVLEFKTVDSIIAEIKILEEICGNHYLTSTNIQKNNPDLYDAATRIFPAFASVGGPSSWDQALLVAGYNPYEIDKTLDETGKPLRKALSLPLEVWIVNEIQRLAKDKGVEYLDSDNIEREHLVLFRAVQVVFLDQTSQEGDLSSWDQALIAADINLTLDQAKPRGINHAARLQEVKNVIQRLTIVREGGTVIRPTFKQVAAEIPWVRNAATLDAYLHRTHKTNLSKLGGRKKGESQPEIDHPARLAKLRDIVTSLTVIEDGEVIKPTIDEVALETEWAEDGDKLEAYLKRRKIKLSDLGAAKRTLMIDHAARLQEVRDVIQRLTIVNGDGTVIKPSMDQAAAKLNWIKNGKALNVYLAQIHGVNFSSLGGRTRGEAVRSRTVNPAAGSMEERMRQAGVPAFERDDISGKPVALEERAAAYARAGGKETSIGQPQGAAPTAETTTGGIDLRLIQIQPIIR